MKYDDGFVAYLNGDPLSVAEINNPSADQLNFESIATTTHGDADSIVDEVFPLSTSLLNVGNNVLSIHGLNRFTTSSDALFLPTLEGVEITGGATPAYFTTPTPGSANIAGVSSPGPLVRSVTKDLPPLNLGAGNLVIEADVTPTLNPIASVSLVSRIMYLSLIHI